MKFAKSTKLVLIGAAVLLMLQLFVSSRLTTLGEDVAEMENRAEQLDRENMLLKQKIASSSALTNVRTKAADLGFRETDQVLFLDNTVFVAQK